MYPAPEWLQNVSLTTPGGQVEVAFAHHPCSGSGKAPRLLLIHGNPGSMADWQECVPRFREFAEVALFDWPGFGLSPTPAEAKEVLSIGNLAAAALQLARELGWEEPFHLVGQSTGGAIAQLAANLEPARVLSVSALGSMGHPAGPSKALVSLPGLESAFRLLGWGLQRPSGRGWKRRVFELGMRGVFAPDPVLPTEVDYELELFQRRPEILRHMLQMLRGDPHGQVLANSGTLEAPTQFLHGEGDRTVPPQSAKNLWKRLSERGVPTRFQSFPGGHMFHRFRAEEVASWVREWVQSHGSTRNGNPG